MGLFSNKCPRCQSSNSKKANNCNQCGEPMQQAWRKCRCGASCGATSKACWNCGADLTAQPASELFGDRWSRSVTDFAVRFPLRAPEGVVHHGVQVDEGTEALLLVNGRLEETLRPGYHVMTGFFERLTGIEKKGEQSEAVLFSAAPMFLSFDVDGLHDSEQVPLSAVLKLGVEMEDARRFLIAAFPSRINSFGSAELGELIGDELYQLVQKRASTYSIQSLLSDVSQREGLEAVLGAEIGPLLHVYGLRFTGLRLARLTGEAVEAIREKLGTKAVRVRTYELERELEELDRHHRLKSITTTYEYNELEKQLELDYALKDAERDLLRKRWESNTGHQLTLEALNRETEERRARFAADQALLKDHRGAEIETESHVDEMLRITRARELSGLRHGAAVAGAEGDIELIRAGIRIKIEKTEDDYRREKQRQDAEAAREQDEKDLELAAKAREGAMAAQERMKRMERDDASHRQELADRSLRTRAEVLRGLGKEEIMGVVQDRSIAESLLRLAEIQAGKELSYAPGPYNQSHSGLPAQSAFQPFGPAVTPPQVGIPGWSVPAAPQGYHAVPPAFSPAGGISDDRKLQLTAERAKACVGVIVAEGAGQSQAFGTGWMAGSRILATNAHVAVAAQEFISKGMAIWITFGGDHGRTQVKVERILPHSKYGDPGPGPDGKQAAVPAFDVAIMILDRDMPQWLNIAGPEKIVSLTQGQRVCYSGFPMEGVAGGGINLGNPEPAFKTGIISAVTDWWLGRCPPSQALLIQHDLGVAGGASGSPLMDVDGCVIGLISAGSHAFVRDAHSGETGRIPSGVLLNYAQRVDLLGQLLVS